MSLSPLSELMPLLLLLLLLCGGLQPAAGGQACNGQQTAEAEKAFKNCVESAQSSIIAQAAKQERQEDLCSALDNMLSVCQQQTGQLADCKGRAHAEHVRSLHLSATADIVHSLNQRVNVEECSVFTRKTSVPAGQAEGEGEGEALSAGSGADGLATRPRWTLSCALVALVWKMLLML